MPDDSNLAMRTLLLGGTVALPSPFPAVGRLRVAKEKEVGKIIGQEVKLRLLVIEHTLEPATQIVRIVQLRHVRAVFKPEDCDDPEWDRGEWVFPDESFEGELDGIVFVPEAAPIMTKVVFGGTAAESAEYRPPTATNGCDPDFHYGCDP